MKKTIRVLLADDHPVVRAGIRTILAAESDLAVVAEAANGEEARRLCLEHRPDVVLLDLNMPGPAAAETAAYLRRHCPETKILALTAYDDDVYVRGMVDGGASGYVLKDEATDVVVHAVRTVMEGEQWFSRRVLRRVVQRKGAGVVEIGDASLTEREREILGMLAQGCANAQIAASLGLAGQTVRNYLNGIYSKLNVKSRGEAIVWAREKGIVGLDPDARPRPGL